MPGKFPQPMNVGANLYRIDSQFREQYTCQRFAWVRHSMGAGVEYQPIQVHEHTPIPVWIYVVRMPIRLDHGRTVN